MSINRENYEIWFIDWLDDNLSASQIRELENFLDANPDLRKEFMILSEFSLKPGSTMFPFRDKLKRSPADISAEQFDILCASWLEKDLSPEQEADLLELARSDPHKQKSFEITGRTKLVPPVIVYPYKSRLLKKTSPAAGIFRLVVLSLSAAALIAIVLLTGVFRQDVITPVTEATVAEDVSAVENTDKPAEVLMQSKTATAIIKQPESVKKQIVAGLSSEKSQFSAAGARIPVEIEKIAFDPVPELTAEPGNSLVAIGAIPLPVSGYDDRSKVGKFIARTFREKILKDSTQQNIPLKGYEIAEAGIEGLNWLLGWDMALSRNNDEEGNVKSVKFSSRIVKFQAPVKNNELAE